MWPNQESDAAISVQEFDPMLTNVELNKHLHAPFVATGRGPPQLLPWLSRVPHALQAP